MRKGLLFTLIILSAAPVLGIASAHRDGAIIRNSGSTNTAGFTIRVWSDATGSASVQGAPPKTFGIPNDVSARFFADLHAARSENAPATHCMKSASFGTSTSVVWHGWSSPDLQCPPYSASLGALAQDVGAIQAAAGITTQLRHRIGLPHDLRKIPTPTPRAADVKYPVLILTAALALVAAAPPPPTPPPTPPPLTDTQASPVPSGAPGAASPDAAPLVTPTPNLDSILGGMPAAAKPKPGAKRPPAPPAERKGLDGVWEVQIQRGPNTEYEHMNLTQTGQTLSGIFLTKDNKKYPVTGSVDPQNNLRLVVSLPDGSTILLEARVDGTTDMLGMFTDAKERVPFTAAYRPKEKWIENINATPGGLGGGSGP